MGDGVNKAADIWGPRMLGFLRQPDLRAIAVALISYVERS
jgi:hypothetical protein